MIFAESVLYTAGFRENLHNSPAVCTELSSRTFFGNTVDNHRW